MSKKKNKKEIVKCSNCRETLLNNGNGVCKKCGIVNYESGHEIFSGDIWDE